MEPTGCGRGGVADGSRYAHHRLRSLRRDSAAHAQGRRGGRPCALDADTLAVTIARHARGESVTAIARHLGLGRSTLYRALGGPQPTETDPPTRLTAGSAAVRS